MKIWIDADAAPRDVKEIVFRAAKRLEIRVVLVAGPKDHGPGEHCDRVYVVVLLHHINRARRRTVVVVDHTDRAMDNVLRLVDDHVTVVAMAVGVAASVAMAAVGEIPTRRSAILISGPW